MLGINLFVFVVCHPQVCVCMFLVASQIHDLLISQEEEWGMPQGRGACTTPSTAEKIQNQPKFRLQPTHCTLRKFHWIFRFCPFIAYLLLGSKAWWNYHPTWGSLGCLLLSDLAPITRLSESLLYMPLWSSEQSNACLVSCDLHAIS